MVDPLAISPEPAGRFSFRQVLPTLVFDVAMPVIAFFLLSGYGVSTLWALVASGLSPAINNVRVWAKSRRLNPARMISCRFLKAAYIFFHCDFETLLPCTSKYMDAPPFN